jgi:hypothetical protein
VLEVDWDYCAQLISLHLWDLDLIQSFLFSMCNFDVNFQFLFNGNYNELKNDNVTTWHDTMKLVSNDFLQKKEIQSSLYKNNNSKFHNDTQKYNNEYHQKI